MDQYIGQITVIIEADSPIAAEHRLRTLADRLQTTEADIVFADHNGDVDEMFASEAECEASLSTADAAPRVQPNRKNLTMTELNYAPSAGRANRLEEILLKNRTSEDPHETLVDLLADAMHWCDFNGDDFHLALARAGRHFINELNGEQPDERRMKA